MSDINKLKAQAAKLLAARRALGVNQIEAGKILNCCEKTYVGWEKGYKLLRPHELRGALLDLSDASEESC